MPARSYKQYCALAKAMDVVGDRWALLVVRNLLLGPQRWSELRDTLPGVAKNLLSERLHQLEVDGILVHEDGLYQLTPRGQELEAVVFALGNWGDKHVMGAPTAGEAIRLRYFMTSLRRKLRPCKASGWLQLRIDEKAFAVRLGSRPTVVQGQRAGRASVSCTFMTLVGVLLRGESPGPLEKQGALRIEGERTLFTAFRESVRPRA